MSNRLAEHLVHRGLLPAERLQLAQERVNQLGGTLDSSLLEQGDVSEAGMLQAIADVSGFKAVNLADFEPNAEMGQLVPQKIADRLNVVPLSVEGGALHVACAYPVPAEHLQEVALLLGKRLEVWVAVECRIRDWISTLYKAPLSPRYRALVQMLAAPVELERRATPGASLVETTTLEEQLSSAAVEKLARGVLEEPILLDVKKSKSPSPMARASALRPAPAPAPTSLAPVSLPGAHAMPSAAPYDRVETVVLDTSGYAAFAREAMKPGTEEAGPPSVIIDPSLTQPQDERWEVPRSPAEVAPLGGPSFGASSANHEIPVPPTAHDAPTVPHGTPTVSRPAPVAPLTQDAPDWTLEQARQELSGASVDRERTIDVTLQYARRTFEFAAAFAIMRGSAVGWTARGEGADPARLAQVHVPLDALSVFRTVALTRGSYVGPVPADSLTRHFLEQFGRSPRSVFLFPIEVRGKLVAIVYADNGLKPLSQRRLSEFILFCQELPAAFQNLILQRRQRSEPPPGELAAPAYGLDGDEPAVAAPPSTWSPSTSTQKTTTGRMATLPSIITAESERPPPDFALVLRRLTGPDAALRARAMADLACSPEASARALAQAFPGPTGWARLPVVELPDADELGPIPGALVRLGRSGARALAPLIDSNDSDVRYFALLTAGSLAYPDVVDGILRGLFDFEPEISSAARASASALRRLRGFGAAMRGLRQELAGRDPLRRSLAARALGALHDREAIDGLIGLTGSDDQMVAEAAAEALKEITKQPLGPTPLAWSAWWAENRTRRRLDWLVEALRHPDLEVRMSAIDELSRAFSDDLGYHPEAAVPERDAAVRKWEVALAQAVRGQFDL